MGNKRGNSGRDNKGFAKTNGEEHIGFEPVKQ